MMIWRAGGHDFPTLQFMGGNYKKIPQSRTSALVGEGGCVKMFCKAFCLLRNCCTINFIQNVACLVLAMC